MRLVIDLQAAQGSSRHRGIGRYGMSLAQGLVRNGGDHEVFVVLNGLFADTIEPIRDAFHGLIPAENIVVWDAPRHVRAERSENDARRQATELMRESVIARLAPDYVLVSSLFEGLGDDIVTSVGELTSSIPTAVILYDLIPLIHRGIYLPNALVEDWYQRKVGAIRNANLLLAISESARQESVDYLGLEEQATVNISTAAESHFSPAPVSTATGAHLARVYGLTRPFVMYTGGIDHRKNIEGLIEAFSRLPTAVRRAHQLAIVCSIQDAVRLRLMQLASKLGLAEDELVLTGYISEDDLLACYRACKLFVFPSWHEGFGLPALEAMQCGRAVIASDRSSLPEVIGLKSALFDPFDLEAMSRKIASVLTDDRMRESLERHGLEQAKTFSWDETARRAWAAMEASHAALTATPPVRATPQRRPRLAYVSPLPPEASGISDYSAELLPELARHYRIDVIVAQGTVSDPWVRGNCGIHDTAWFTSHAQEFDRILYHFGNSQFHAHMFDLLREHPGTVVLHDFFLSAVVGYRDATGISRNELPQALQEAHGWPALLEHFVPSGAIDSSWTYPCNLQVLQDALGIIVHAEYSRRLAKDWFGGNTGSDWDLIPLLRYQAPVVDRETARAALGIAPGDFVVCSFGMLGPMKLNDKLLSAWRASPLGQNENCHLVFVGENDRGDYGIDMIRSIRSTRSAGRIEITGWTDAATFRRWLNAADAGVQLRALSRGETSATVLDCMNVGMATIVNANGSMAELPTDCVWHIEDEFTEQALVDALSALWQDSTRREKLGRNARAYIARNHNPRRCADAYAKAIESHYEAAAVSDYGVSKALSESDRILADADLKDLAFCMARNMPPRPRLKRLYVDVSELVQRDARSGIQRVVRAILSQWLRSPPVGWIVEPVYAEAGIPGYRHARRFTSRFLDIWEGWSEDEWVEPFSGDVFIGLDLVPTIVPQQADILQGWRRRGVTVQFVIYDLLPLSLPDLFPEGVPGFHHDWLRTLSDFDGVVCISRAVADEFRLWLDHYGPKRERPLSIHWFHLGADAENSVPTRGLPQDSEQTLAKLRADPSFLSVGTLEPRKGYRQTLAGFEKLWAKGVAANLVLVGKQGWLMQDFAEELRTHQQANVRLFWLESISDEYLESIYAACSYLVAASEGEGFGLPLIEAARHHIPALTRDIPVFREVGGSAATYFPNSNDPEVIATAVRGLLAAPRGTASTSGVVWQTWAQSAKALADRILEPTEPYHQWENDGVLRLWGTDIRMLSDTGKQKRRQMVSVGEAGFLAYGPNLPAAAGSYRLSLFGSAKHLTGKEHVSVVSNRGERRHLHASLSASEGYWRVVETLVMDEPVSDFEVRLWVDEKSELSLDTITLEAAADPIAQERDHAIPPSTIGELCP